MKIRLAIPLLVLLIAALACNVPSAESLKGGTPESVGSMLTQVAETVNAELTRTPGFAGTADPAAIGTPGAAAAPGAGTPFPTLALIPTSTTSGGDPQTEDSEETPAACDMAAFVEDVTVPDGTLMAPGEAFTKTWRLRNTGTCTWTTGYALVFVSGDALGAPATVALLAPVEPDATADLAVPMQAPAEPGEYTGFWRLRNASGMQFGTGADQPFYVQIEVSAEAETQDEAAVAGNLATATPGSTTAVGSTTASATQETVVDLAEIYCRAMWRTQTGVLACPGKLSDASGSITRPIVPVLETGAAEPDPVLVTVPNKTTDGVITGQYPTITIEDGMHFRAELGCMNSAPGCSVVYQLNYIAGSAKPVSLGQWAHTYNGTLKTVEVDLSALKGQRVSIVLAVLAHGTADEDQAVWVNPRIQK